MYRPSLWATTKSSSRQETPDCVTFQTGFVGERARHKIFTHASGAGDDDILVTLDPVTTGQVQHESSVKATVLAVVYIFHTGHLPELGSPQTGLEPGILARSRSISNPSRSMKSGISGCASCSRTAADIPVKWSRSSLSTNRMGQHNLLAYDGS